MELPGHTGDKPIQIVGIGRAARRNVDVGAAQVEIILSWTVRTADRRVARERARDVAVAERVVLDARRDHRLLRRGQKLIVDAEDQVAGRRPRHVEDTAVIFRLSYEVGALAVGIPTFTKNAKIVVDIEVPD